MEETPLTTDWDATRARYEARDETVAQIAGSIGLTSAKLGFEAKKRGWLLRKDPLSGVGKPITSTKEAIERLKQLLQKRIARLEEINGSADAESNERSIRTANLLARTLEKVLDLEHHHRKQNKLRTASARNTNDTWRHELARRIARLSSGASRRFGESPDAEGSEDLAGGLAAVGPA